MEKTTVDGSWHSILFGVYFNQALQMTKTITLKALRPELPRVADAIESKLDRYIVTRRGQPVMMIISPEDYEGLLETIEILSDKAAAKRILKSRKEAQAGKTVSLEALRRRLEGA